MVRGIRLALALAGSSVLLLLTSQAHSVVSPEDGFGPVAVSGGYSGYAVPLPDYAARVVEDSDSAHPTASLVYGDISLAPLRIHLDESRADASLEVVVRNRACAVSLPPSAAFIVEPSAELPDYIAESGEGASARVSSRLRVTLPAQSGPDYYLPVQLYQVSQDAASTVLQVELMLAGEAVSRKTVELKFLPRGKVYSCLVEPEGRGLLTGDSLALGGEDAAGEDSVDPRLRSPGFLQEHALLSVAPAGLGPDFRVLRHFAFVVISEKTWFGLNERERTLLSEAAAMGSRLVIYGAGKELEMGGGKYFPQPGLALNSYGFGEVALSAENLTALRDHLAALLRRRLSYAYNLALGGFAEEVGASAQRDLIVRGTLGNLNRGHSWLGYLSALPESERPINPIWAYDYITRGGLLHPLDVERLRWDSPAPGAAGTELVERGESDSAPLQRYLSDSVSRSPHPYGVALVVYTLLALALALFLFAYRRSYLWLVLAFLALSALATALLGLGCSSFGRPEILVLSSTLTCPGASAGEVRHTLYLTSGRASELDVGLSVTGFALGRVAPLDASRVSMASAAGNKVVLQDLRVAPLVPLEISYTGLWTGDPPASHSWRMLAEGERELTLRVGEPLSFSFLVDGARALYLGRMEGELGRSVVLPPKEADAGNVQVRDDTLVAAQAYQAFSADRRENARGTGSAKLAELASRFLSEALLHEVIRTLVADGRGITLLGLRCDEYQLTLDGEAVPAPRAELVVYRLE